MLKKILILFIGSVAIPLGIQNIVYYRQIEANIQSQMIQRLETALTDKADKLNAYLSGAVSLARLYHRNEQLYNYLDLSYESERSYLSTYQNELKNLFDESTPYYLQVKEMMVYTDNPTVFGGAYIKKSAGQEEEEFIVNVIEEGAVDQETEILGGEQFYAILRIGREPSRLMASEDRNISIFCPLDYYPQYDRYHKVLRLNMNLPYMGDVLVENNIFDNMILADENGRVLAS